MQNKKTSDMNLKELIDFVSDSKVLDKDENVLNDEYWEAMEKIRDTLHVPDKSEFDSDITKLKRNFRKHEHKDGNVVIRV